MMKTVLVVVAMGLAGPVLAYGPSDARLASDLARNDRQDARVDAGVASGRINPREAAYLDQKLNRIDRSTTRLAADGRYSRVDAARIDRRQDTASRHIARAKTNRR